MLIVILMSTLRDLNGWRWPIVSTRYSADVLDIFYKFQIFSNFFSSFFVSNFIEYLKQLKLTFPVTTLVVLGCHDEDYIIFSTRSSSYMCALRKWRYIKCDTSAT